MNRFKWWAMSLFSSILVLFSLAYNFYENETFGREEIRVLALYAPTILLSMGGVMTSICCKGRKAKPWIETALILLNLVAWIIIGIATLVGTSTLTDFNDLVIDSTSDAFNIGEPNIYFFSFGSLFNANFLFASWFKQYILRDENSLTTTQWTLLALSGFLVMATGMSKLEQASCHQGRFYSCGRTWASIFIGLISGVSGCFMLPWRTAPLKCQAELAFILVVTWGVAIGLLTFGDGPALYINTMYLGIYFSFFIAMNIFTTTLYADSVLEASPNSQIEFGRRESQISNDVLGAAGILDIAYANITRVSTDEYLNNDPRHADESIAMLFESVGGSISSLDNPNSTPRSQSGRGFNRKVVVGKREYSRVEIWFWLFVESSVCLAVFRDDINTCEAVIEQWIIIAPALSIGISFVGWFTSSIKKKWAYYIEGVLILICIILWIRGLIAVTRYFIVDSIADDDTIDDCYDGNVVMTANQLFMSYGSFFTSLYLITEWSDASITTTDWVFLTAASGTIFGVLFIGHPDAFEPCTLGFCDLEIKLVVALSLGSACISFLMVLVSFISCGKVVPIFHVVIGATLLTLWCVGTYFIAFQKEGVGSEIGPTFFACWGSLFFCVDIATTNIVLLFKEKMSDESVSSLNDDDEENYFVNDQPDNQGLNGANVDTNGFGLKTVSEYATGEEEVLSIVTDGASSRIEYKQRDTGAQEMLSENSSTELHF